jgi:hypothetical protein
MFRLRALFCTTSCIASTTCCGTACRSTAAATAINGTVQNNAGGKTAPMGLGDLSLHEKQCMRPHPQAIWRSEGCWRVNLMNRRNRARREREWSDVTGRQAKDRQQKLQPHKTEATVKITVASGTAGA